MKMPPDPPAGRWSIHADFGLTHARMRAERGDTVGIVGQVAEAVIEIAHALACRRRVWALTGKKLIERVGLQNLHARFVDVPAAPPELVLLIENQRALPEHRKRP